MAAGLREFVSEHKRLLGTCAGTICLVYALATLFGTDGPDIRTVPVGGVVTLQGQPLASIVVRFEPVFDSTRPRDALAQPGSFAVTDANGRYELDWGHGAGAVPGTHRVILVWRDAGRDDSEPEDALPESSSGEYVQLEKTPEFRLPLKARDGSLRFTVPDDGTDSADFAF